MKLHEITNIQPQSFYTNQEDIEHWLYEQNIANFTINEDGTVDVAGDVILKSYKGSTLPVQFGIVHDGFSIQDSNLTSFVGAPRSVGKWFNGVNTKVSSIAGMPSYIGQGLGIWNTRIHSLSGIHKVVRVCKGHFSCNKNVTHILGLLLVKGIIEVNIDSGELGERNGPIDNIINKYLGTENVIMAQDELLDAGFIEQAKI